MKIRIRSNGNSISINKFSQAGWQFLFHRHRCTPNQKGNYEDISVERSLNLNSDKVVGILETILSLRVRYFRPLISNNNQKDLALIYRFFQMLFKINPRRDRIHILEYS